MFRPRRHHGGMGGRRAPGLAIWLLVAQILQVGLDRIPPVTLALIASQSAIYLRLIHLPFGGISNVCISSLEVWYKEDWKRLLLASFYHASEWHLYFNMVSLLWKGINLERHYGSKYFAYLISVFALLTNIIYVAVGILASEALDQNHYVRQCAVGFSGVLFGLKVVASHLSPPGTQYLMGFIPFPSRIACWAELVLIHLLVPNSSFLGHLAGILVGWLYIKGPLKAIMDYPIPSLTGTFGTRSYRYTAAPSGHSSYRSSDRQTYRPGRVYNYNNQQQHWPNQDLNNYTGGLSEEEQIARAMEQSRRDQPSPGHSTEPSAPPFADYNPNPPYPPQSSSMPQPEPAQNSSGSRLYPDLDDLNSASQRTQEMEDLRRRRLQRFS